jgi:hypothetical protein
MNDDALILEGTKKNPFPICSNRAHPSGDGVQPTSCTEA